MNKRIESFYNKKCKECKNKKTDLCEIIISRYSGQAYCKNYEKEIKNGNVG